jgi:hypothetical protein
MNAADTLAGELCLACGLCCNGVLFKDVELQAGDDGARLEALGLPVCDSGKTSKFSQPCAALCADNRCRLYAERPARCREFECALFKAVLAGDLALSAALRTVQTAQQRAGKVRRLLRQLGDTRDHLALSLRFKRTRQRLESRALNAAATATFGDLTLAVQALNLLLSARFYPGPRPVRRDEAHRD